MFNLFNIVGSFTHTYNMKKIINQQQSSEKENVQRLERKLVPLDGEMENTLAGKAEGKDIVQNLRSLSKLLSKEKFLEKAHMKYGNKFTYDLGNYAGITKNKIKVTCPIHGEFEVLPHTFLLKNCKTGCKKCGHRSKDIFKTKSYKNFLEKVNKVFNKKYEYPTENKEIYINRKTKIKIICREHGEFIKSAQKHLSGQGCFKCKVKQMVEDGILVGGYSEELFNKNPELKNKVATLYYLRINNGEFYKIGITIKSISSRIKSLKYKSKGRFNTFETLWSLQDTLYNCFKKEQEILNIYNKERIYLDISTELFNKDVLRLELKHIPIIITQEIPLVKQ
jgi:hypothetical protein